MLLGKFLGDDLIGFRWNHLSRLPSDRHKKFRRLSSANFFNPKCIYQAAEFELITGLESNTNFADRFP